MSEQLRAKLVLGKFPVLERTSDGFRLKLGGTTEAKFLLVDQSLNYDVRAGDLLTLYTEVFIKPPKGS